MGVGKLAQCTTTNNGRDCPCRDYPHNPATTHAQSVKIPLLQRRATIQGYVPAEKTENTYELEYSASSRYQHRPYVLRRHVSSAPSRWANVCLCLTPTCTVFYIAYLVTTALSAFPAPCAPRILLHARVKIIRALHPVTDTVPDANRACGRKRSAREGKFLADDASVYLGRHTFA